MDTISTRSPARRGALAAVLASLTLAAALSVFAVPVLGTDESPGEEPSGDNASLNIRKVDENNARLEGAIFTIQGMEGTFTTGADGQVCIDGLPNDTMWLVTEIEAPEGYQIADPASQWVETDDDGDCDSPDAVFVNLPAPAATPVATPVATPAATPVQPAATPRESTAAGQGGPRGALPNTATDEPMTPVLPLSLIVVASAALVARRQLARVGTRR